MKHFVLPMLMMAAIAAPSAARAADALSAAQKKEVEAMIKDYILNNGSAVIESVNKFQQEQEESSNKESEVKASELIKKLKTDKEIASVGNPDGDVLVVEFFDYNCGYCKKAFTEVQTLLKDDKNVRVVFYDMPILGPDSYVASKWALASKKQNKYWEFHQAVMTHQGALDTDALTKISKDAGIDVEKLKKDLEDPAIEEDLKVHLQTAKDLKIQGTPGFLVNEQVFRGYIPYDAMKSAVETARKNAKK